MTENGEKIAPPIAWDRKTGDSVTTEDIEKAKKYKTIHNTDYSIIVTAKGITKRDSNHTLIGTREGIYLVHPTIVVEIAKLIRSFIIRMAKTTISNKERASKQDKLFEWMTSVEYARTIGQIREIKSDLDDYQRKEEEYHKKLWHKRKNKIREWYKIDELNQKIIDRIVNRQTIELCEIKEMRIEQ